MKSLTTPSFWREFNTLPASVQEQSIKAYQLWRADPTYPSLQFKRVSRVRPVYSIRIGLSYRALGRMEGDTVIWFWIGHHDVYDRLLGSRP
jgi:hypothetical protein